MGVIPNAISDDGRVVVGEGYNPRSGYVAFWYQTGQRVREIKPPMWVTLRATGVSADGLTIVGYGVNTSVEHQIPIFWHRREGFMEINDNPDRDMRALGISGDGRVVVGILDGPGGFGAARPFRWSATEGLLELETLDGRQSGARAVSYNGKVIVGNDWVGEGELKVFRAYRWLSDGKAELLGSLGGETSEGAGVSADGSVIVGSSQTSDGSYHAYRWTRYGSPRMQQLDLGTQFINSFGTAVSNQGHIVGSGLERGVTSAFLWTPLDGLKSLNERFRSALPRGITLHSAEDISADGRWITGRALHPRRGIIGYILDTGRQK